MDSAWCPGLLDVTPLVLCVQLGSSLWLGQVRDLSWRDNGRGSELLSLLTPQPATGTCLTGGVWIPPQSVT